MCFISYLLLRILYNPLGTHTAIMRQSQPKAACGGRDRWEGGMSEEEVSRIPNGIKGGGHMPTAIRNESEWNLVDSSHTMPTCHSLAVPMVFPHATENS